MSYSICPLWHVTENLALSAKDIETGKSKAAFFSVAQFANKRQSKELKAIQILYFISFIIQYISIALRTGLC
jgi:hypothetical protein